MSVVDIQTYDTQDMALNDLWGFDIGALRSDLNSISERLASNRFASLVSPTLVIGSSHIADSLNAALDALSRWTPNATSLTSLRGRGETQIVVLLTGLERAWLNYVRQQLTPEGVALVLSLIAEPVPDFLSILGRKDNENSHSQIVSFFLDPRSAPSMAGDVLVGLMRDVPDVNGVQAAVKASAQLRTAVSRREYPIDVDGRKGFIDVLVTSGSFAVAIENKVHSSEHSRQTEHYAEWLRRHYSKHAGIMLSPSGVAPLAEGFRGVSYLRFVACLCESALRNGMVESERMIFSSYLKTLRNSVLRSELGLLTQGK